MKLTSMKDIIALEVLQWTKTIIPSIFDNEEDIEVYSSISKILKIGDNKSYRVVPVNEFNPYKNIYQALEALEELAVRDGIEAEIYTYSTNNTIYYEVNIFFTLSEWKEGEKNYFSFCGRGRVLSKAICKCLMNIYENKPELLKGEDADASMER